MPEDSFPDTVQTLILFSIYLPKMTNMWDSGPRRNFSKIINEISFRLVEALIVVNLLMRVPN